MAAIQTVLNGFLSTGTTNVQFLGINSPLAKTGLDLLAPGIVFPVLQDTVGTNVHNLYQASSYTVILVDTAGYFAKRFENFLLPNDEQQLIDDLTVLSRGERLNGGAPSRDGGI